MIANPIPKYAATIRPIFKLIALAYSTPNQLPYLLDQTPRLLFISPHYLVRLLFESSHYSRAMFVIDSKRNSHAWYR